MQRQKDKVKEHGVDPNITEIGHLPTEWDIVPFTESILNKRISVGKIKKRDYKESGKYPIIDQGQGYIGGYWDDREALYEGELPVVIFGDHTRIFKFVDFPFIRGADGVKVLVPDREKYDPHFFYYACLNLDISSRGYNRHYKYLKEKSLPHPPLLEQRRIAWALRVIQEAITAQEKVIAAARELKRSLMERLFTYGPNPKPAPTKETKIGEIPDKWDLISLSYLAKDFFSGGTPSTSKEKYWKGNIPWITSAYISDFIIEAGERYITQSGLQESSANIVPKDNILIGTRVGVGKVAINQIDLAINQDVTGMIVDKNKVNLFFLTYVIQWERLQEIIKSFSKGTTIKGISRKDLIEVPIPFPSKEEQQVIANYLNTIDSKISSEQQRKAALEELFKSSLEQLMTGQVRLM